MPLSEVSLNLKTTEVQTSNAGFTSEVSDYLVVHTGPGLATVGPSGVQARAAAQLSSVAQGHCPRFFSVVGVRGTNTQRGVLVPRRPNLGSAAGLVYDAREATSFEASPIP